MFFSTLDKCPVIELFNSIGIKKAAESADSAIIKINLARPPEKGHPRTSPDLLTTVIKYLSTYGIKCTIAESADGYLESNINNIGLANFVKKYNVKLIDLDLEEVDNVIVGDETHYIPKCLKEYDIRIAIPATSKRPGMNFSNNVKLFIGAVPRRFYQIGNPVRHRPKIHVDLHKSVANIYKSIMKHVPFDYFINGGLSMHETKGEFKIPEILAGDNGVELDLYVIKKYFNIEIPGYINRLLNNQ